MSKFTLWKYVIYMKDPTCDECGVGYCGEVDTSARILIQASSSPTDGTTGFHEYKHDPFIVHCVPYVDTVYNLDMTKALVEYDQAHRHVLKKSKVLGLKDCQIGWITFSEEEQDWCIFETIEEDQSIKDVLLEIMIEKLSLPIPR